MQRKDEHIIRCFQRITSVYVICIASAFMLFPGFGGYGQITQYKWTLYCTLTVCFLLIVGGLRLELAVIGEKPLTSPIQFWKQINYTQRFIFCFWILAGISALCSIDRCQAFWGSERREGFITITLYCFSFLFVSCYFRPHKAVFYVFGISIGLCCIIAIIQLAGLNPFNLYPSGISFYDGNKLYSGQFLGTIGNIDLISALLSLAIPCFCVALLRLKEKQRFFILIPLVLSLYVLLRSSVAGGIVGVLLGTLISLPIVVPHKKTRVVLTIGVIVVSVVGIVAIYAFGDRGGGTIFEIHEILHGRWNDDFGSGRIYIWRKALELVPEHPFLGGGPDTFGLRTDAAFERFDSDLGLVIHNNIDVAHNEYLNILVNQGIFSVIVYLLAAISALTLWGKEARNDITCGISGAAVLSYLIQAFFGISTVISAPFFWLMFAVLVRRKNNSKA